MRFVVYLSALYIAYAINPTALDYLTHSDPNAFITFGVVFFLADALEWIKRMNRND